MISKQPWSRTRRLALANSGVFLLLSVFSSGCSDDTTSNQNNGATANTSGPVYALTTQVLGADAADNHSYIVLTSTLDGSEALSLDSAIELPGRALGTGPENGGALFVAGDDSPNVTRYDLQPNGNLIKGNAVSFQGKGLATIGEYGAQFAFVSETKAYFFDGPTAQVVVWNPKEMTVTGSVALSDLVLADSTLSFSAAPLRRTNEVITFAGWRKGPLVPSRAAVVIVDTQTDAATVVTDSRCGYVRDGIEASDGKIYLATEAYGAAVNRLNTANAAAPCLLRFDPVTRSFDPNFHVELNSLFSGVTSGSLIRGADNTMFLRVLDETAFTIKSDTHPRVLASAVAWKWAKLTAADTPTVESVEGGPHNGSIIPLTLGERRFAPLFAEGKTTKFLELNAQGPGAITLTVPGLVFSATKLK